MQSRKAFASLCLRGCILLLAPLLGVLVSAAPADRPSLIDAAKNGDKGAVRAFLQQGANVNATQADGATALHWASYRDDVDSADLLIRAGADVNAANDLGATPLWTACLNGSSAMVRRLLQAGANPNRALAAGETPLMIAARSGYAEVVEQLLAKGGDSNARGARGQTALMWAVSQRHPEVVGALLAHHADIALQSEVWSEMMAVPPHGLAEYNRMIPHGGETALMFAARSGDLQSAKLLLAAGANANDADAWGVSAVTLAAHSGFADVVDLLLEKGADPNRAPAGFTALHEAIMRRDARMAAALLSHGADANARLQTWTPMRRDSKDLNFQPGLVGASPFWLAARFTEPDVMSLLVQHGADARFVHHARYAVNGRGGQAFEYRSETTTAVMAALGMSRATPWVQPAKGEVEALTLAAVKLAVDLGVDVNAANTDGRTALDAAAALEYDSVVTYLTGKSARPGTKKDK
jgi:ankyrin